MLAVRALGTLALVRLVLGALALLAPVSGALAITVAPP